MGILIDVHGLYLFVDIDLPVGYFRVPYNAKRGFPGDLKFHTTCSMVRTVPPRQKSEDIQKSSLNA